MTSLFSQSADLDIEPDPVVDAAPAAALDIEPDPEPAPEPSAVPAAALMQVLPADFPLPALIRFVPDARLKAAADEAASYALGIEVAGPDGLQRADVALTALRTCQKAIEEHFAEPVATANDLHKRLTGLRAEWCAGGKTAMDTVGRRIYTEQRRLEAIAAEERRKAQEEEDRKARELARKEAEAAARAKAPEPVVQELKRQAETATAPPVQRAASAPPPLKGTSTVENWKCTIAGTPRDQEPNPAIEKVTATQRVQVFNLLKAILDGRAPIAAIEINWSYVNKRAKADKSTFSIPGLEAFDAGGVRARATRGK